MEAVEQILNLHKPQKHSGKAIFFNNRMHNNLGTSFQPPMAADLSFLPANSLILIPHKYYHCV